MKRRVLFIVSFFVLLPFFGKGGNQAFASTPGTATVHTQEAQGSHTSFPVGHAVLFALNQQAENALQPTNSLLGFVSFDNTVKYHFQRLSGTSGYRAAMSGYLDFTNTIPLISIVRKLIFPFHSFL